MGRRPFGRDDAQGAFSVVRRMSGVDA